MPAHALCLTPHVEGNRARLAGEGFRRRICRTGRPQQEVGRSLNVTYSRRRCGKSGAVNPEAPTPRRRAERPARSSRPSSSGQCTPRARQAAASSLKCPERAPPPRQSSHGHPAYCPQGACARAQTSPARSIGVCSTAPPKVLVMRARARRIEEARRARRDRRRSRPLSRFTMQGARWRSACLRGQGHASPRSRPHSTTSLQETPTWRINVILTVTASDALTRR